MDFTTIQPKTFTFYFILLCSSFQTYKVYLILYFFWFKIFIKFHQIFTSMMIYNNLYMFLLELIADSFWDSHWGFTFEMERKKYFQKSHAKTSL